MQSVNIFITFVVVNTDIYGINVLTTTKVINIFTDCVDANYKTVRNVTFPVVCDPL
jgi:hypothetical protein